MTEAGIRIRARIELLPSSDGGRTAPVRGSYRPNHNFGGPEDREMTVGFLDFADGQSLSPGETTEIEMTLWPRPGLTENVLPGRTWRIQEGGRLVGFGIVLEVLI